MYTGHRYVSPGCDEFHGRCFGVVDVSALLDNHLASDGDTGAIALVQSRAGLESNKRKKPSKRSILDGKGLGIMFVPCLVHCCRRDIFMF